MKRTPLFLAVAVWCSSALGAPIQIVETNADLLAGYNTTVTVYDWMTDAMTVTPYNQTKTYVGTANSANQSVAVAGQWSSMGKADAEAVLNYAVTSNGVIATNSISVSQFDDFWAWPEGVAANSFAHAHFTTKFLVTEPTPFKFRLEFDATTAYGLVGIQYSFGLSRTGGPVFATSGELVLTHTPHGGLGPGSDDVGSLLKTGTLLPGEYTLFSYLEGDYGNRDSSDDYAYVSQKITLDVQPVPDTGTSALLLGFVLFGLTYASRRRQT